MRLPAELRAESVTAIIDTREQTPWDLSPLRVEAGTLATGDYSLRGLEHVIALERKSLGDFLSCVGTEWRSQVTAQAAIGSALGWIAAGVPVVLAGDRTRAQHHAARLLFITARRRWRELRTLAAGITEETVRA